MRKAYFLGLYESVRIYVSNEVPLNDAKSLSLPSFHRLSSGFYGFSDAYGKNGIYFL